MDHGVEEKEIGLYYSDPYRCPDKNARSIGRKSS
jgi:hypothetical protein